MKKLPIGIYNFEEIITENYYYVDKTSYVHELASTGKYYFLSRPRRFGKSLFLDTLKCAFEGKKMLFKGLYLEKHWDFENTHPVLKFSLGLGRVTGLDELNKNIFSMLETQEKKYNIECKFELVAGRFSELIQCLYEKYNRRVVILIDEYDKPILDNLEDTPRAEEMRDGLKNFYSVIKYSDAFIKFCFITGVSKFSRVSIFSDLNNLKDLSLNTRMGAICGYTQSELEHTFAERLSGIDLKTLAAWYNGYNFLGKEKVYNPFDVLLFLDSGQFGNYWFETATPSFLVRLLRQRKFFLPDLDGIEVNESSISAMSMDTLMAETVLFQTGYLTIDQVRQMGPRRFYRLCFPNLEVKLGFTDSLLAGYTRSPTSLAKVQNSMYQALENKDMSLIESGFKSLFSSIPHEWYTKNNMDQYEGYYASVVYAFLASLGFTLKPEESSNHGRADLIIDTAQVVYVLEFKVIELAGDGVKAINQIKARGYHQQYVQAGREVILVGMDFSRTERNLTGFEWELVP
ncbi:MAG: AAA family ATPase [Desulfobacteraceae bacterium]